MSNNLSRPEGLRIVGSTLKDGANQADLIDRAGVETGIAIFRGIKGGDGIKLTVEPFNENNPNLGSFIKISSSKSNDDPDTKNGYRGGLRYNSADQTCASSDPIPFDTISYNTANLVDNTTRLVIPTGVKFVRICASVSIIGITSITSSPTTLVLNVVKNGQKNDPSFIRHAGMVTRDVPLLINSPTLPVVEGDYFEVYFEYFDSFASTSTPRNCTIKANSSFSIDILE